MISSDYIKHEVASWIKESIVSQDTVVTFNQDYSKIFGIRMDLVLRLRRYFAAFRQICHFFVSNFEIVDDKYCNSYLSWYRSHTQFMNSILNWILQLLGAALKTKWGLNLFCYWFRLLPCASLLLRCKVILMVMPSGFALVFLVD